MALTPGTNSFLGPTSVTIIRQDPFPKLPPGLRAAARIARFAEAVVLTSTPIPSKDKFRPDVTSRQSHRRRLTATKWPVSRGNTITDHSHRENDILSFTGYISDSPFILLGSLVFRNYALQQYDRINQFFEAREPVFVATSMRVYESALIMAFSGDKDLSTGGGIAVSIMLEEIRIVRESLGDKLVDDSLAEAGAGLLLNSTGVSVI